MSEVLAGGWRELGEPSPEHRRGRRHRRSRCAGPIAATAVVIIAAGCGGAVPAPPDEGRRGAGRPTVTAGGSSAASGSEDAPRVVFLGDSLTAGLGLPEEEAYPALVEQRLREEGRAVRVVNAGVSGDTTAGGLARLGWLLRQEPDLMLVALGANDGLRGLSLAATEENLRRIVERAREAGVRVVLAGMLLPPNYGPDYTDGFAAIYPRLAGELDTPLVPFLLEGVAAVEQLNQADGLHPNAAGHRRIAETVLPPLRRLIDRLEEGPSARGS